MNDFRKNQKEYLNQNLKDIDCSKEKLEFI